MSAFDAVIEKYRRIAFSERDKGYRFEKLIKRFLLTNPVYAFSEVWMWQEFPFRDDFGGKDSGIDIVTKTVNGEYWAVQCKCYAEDARIDKPALDSFLSTSTKTFTDEHGKTQKFSTRLFVSTTNHWNAEADITIRNQNPPVIRLNLEDLQNAAVDWKKLDEEIFGESAREKTRSPLEHQTKAIEAANQHFQKSERGKLIMACGTGKTYTALKIAERETQSQGLILFLVPSIALLGQTLSEWANYSEKKIYSICVCSDETASRGRDDDSIMNVDLPLPATTDENKIASQLEFARTQKNFGMTVIFATYQSIDKVAKAQNKLGADFQFDLIICDEAHRTTGYGTEETNFNRVHKNEFISAKKRLYMTATPKLFTSDAKKKAADKDLMLWSMDDAEIYGKEIFYIGFGEAVEKKLLSDYKVIVLTVSDQNISSQIPDSVIQDSGLASEDVVKIIGSINALQKKMFVTSLSLAEVDPAPMTKAVAFCPKITSSKKVANFYNALKMTVEAKHVDGSMSATNREQKLSWLKNADAENFCRILTNVRCLSEGVDVPALDAVIFLSSRKSKIEIVQAVGRVMRKAEGKKYGYIIIPVVVQPDKNPEDVLDKSKDFSTVWEVLNALRAHDERMDIFVQELKMGKSNGHIIIGGEGSGETGEGGEISKPLQINLNFEELQDAIYARMVERVGNRRYWEQWAKDVAIIAERHKNKILQLTDKPAFKNFLESLHENINATISTNDAVEMLSQHLITRPVFEALFANYSFAKNNVVSQSMQKILELLDTDKTDDEQLEKFYNSVRRRCEIANTAKQRQEIIIELYDKFFKTALPMTVEKLGIVYTPVEVVDFILQSVNDVLQKNFNKTLSDRGVNILDPFTGTGTFIVRLIQSGLIAKKNLLYKVSTELHANEIVLLAYYIASINIENAFNADATHYRPFQGICLTDTFEMYERDKVTTLENTLEKNSERIENQLREKIEVIVGNPPYSVGQKSANNNNQNTHYENLEKRIAETYAKYTNATNKNALYDSYIKAFRWAADRIGDSGVIGFVTNGGWLDGAAMDGMRKIFAEEFSQIFIFNLRGNQRTQGEISRKEGGKIFGSGSRAPIAITILVKNPEHVGKAEIFYCDIGDYLSREEKLQKIVDVQTVLSEHFQRIEPNEKFDWINQRGNSFEEFIPLAPEKKFDTASKTFFVTNSKGIETGRDVWSYNFSKKSLQKNIQTSIDFYNENSPENVDDKKIVWTRATVNNKNRGVKIIFDEKNICETCYRPFFKQQNYFDKNFISYPSQMKKIFPNENEKNFVICLPGNGAKKFSVFITEQITDVQFQFNGQCFPMYWYERAAVEQKSLFDDSQEIYSQRDGVSDFIFKQARSLYGERVTKEEIFYYVYGFLHLPGYREKFSAELKKSLPRIFLVDEPQKFWQIAKAGRELAEIHLNYEGYEKPAGVEVEISAENYRVKKMALSKDKKTLQYNSDITIKNIPARCFEYVVNGRSLLDWVIERYQVKIDKDSGIENNPNDWCAEHGDEKYILKLLLSAMTVALKTLEIVENLPSVEFE